MEAAITFADTGHLCLGTLHSSNADQTLHRVMNMFPGERHDEIFLQLSMCLRAIISQRLVRSLDGKRVAAVEILRDTPWVKDLIKSGQVDKVKEGMRSGGSGGCQTFDQDLLRYYSEGKIDRAEALANSDNPNNLRLSLQNVSVPDNSVQTGSESKPGSEASGEETESAVPPMEQWMLHDYRKQEQQELTTARKRA